MKAQLYRPHDLLWLRLPDRFDAGGAWPGWLDAAWLVDAPVVMRREAGTGSRVPVGVRGALRSQRCKGYVQRTAVKRCVTPEMLARQVSAAGRRIAPGAFPCIETLVGIAPALRALGITWGPTGGCGFFLATGLPVLRPDSDLDLLVRAHQRLPAATIDALCSMQAAARCRIDIQVDTGLGGFALAEYVQGRRQTMLKTAHGPILLGDPWDYREAA
jgi:phosphoribosyl-dephospho-CoA transferase